MTREERIANAIEIALADAHACGHRATPMTASQSFADRFVEILDAYHTPIQRWDATHDRPCPAFAASVDERQPTDAPGAGQTTLARWSA